MITLTIAGYLLAGVIGGWWLTTEYRTDLEPEKWTAQEHQKVMRACRKMCGKNKVKGYTSISAECLCYKLKQRD